ncbi:flippase-like domain-containing protein, partial [Candidatus Woesearchaeota archaeon]|nr:flippase-like domain-containing protein [Candidatus Woesearchaeota archaeon]
MLAIVAKVPAGSFFKMRKIKSELLSAIIGIIIVIFLFWYIKVEEILKAFSYFSFDKLILFIIVSIIMMLLHTLKWSIILKSQGCKIPFPKLFIYKLAGFGVSYVTPAAHMGGEPVRAYLLKTNHNIPFKKALSSVVIDKSLDLSLNGFFACITILIILANFTVSERTATLMVLSFFAMAAAIYSFYHLTITEKGFFTTCFRLLRLNKWKLTKKYEKDIKGMELHLIYFFKYNKKGFRDTSLVFLLVWILMFFEYKLALLLLGYNASFVAIFIVLSLVGLAYIIPVPAALGALEFGQSSASAILRVSKGIGLALSIIIRGRDMIWVFLGLSYLALHKIK